MFSKKKAKSTPALSVLSFTVALMALLIGLYVHLHGDRRINNHAKISVIDGQKLWKELPAIKALNQETNILLARQQKELSKLESDLRDENQKILGLQNTSGSRDRTQQKEIEGRQKVFTNRVISLQKKAESAQAEINNRYQVSMNEIRSHVLRTINRFALREGYAMVIYKRQAPFYNSSLDITDSIFHQLEGFKNNKPQKGM